MARRKITFGDWLKGSVNAARSGAGMNPLAAQRYVNAAHDQRVAQEFSVRNLFLQTALRALDRPEAQRALRAYQEAREESSRWRIVDGMEKRGGRDVQYRDGQLVVEVLNGYSRDYDEYTTDVIVTYPDEPDNLHMHIVFDENGRTITEHWKQGGEAIPAPK